MSFARRPSIYIGFWKNEPVKKHQRKRLEGYILKDMESYITFKYITFFLIEYVFSHLSTIFFAKYISIFCQLCLNWLTVNTDVASYFLSTGNIQLKTKLEICHHFVFIPKHLANLISFDIFTWVMPDMSRYNCKWIFVFDLFPGRNILTTN